jgi:formylglycine-generating enzyme required for sulfatase activity
VSSVPGATRYRFELSRTSTPPAGEEPAGEEAPEEPAAEPDAPDDEPAARRRVLEADEPRIVPSLEEGSAYTIRVQVENDTGDRLGWFGPFAFTAARFEMPFAEIIESGEEASFSPVGVTNVPEDFRIRLTRPYAMAVTELSNRHAARIINWALAFGHARLDRETRRVLYLPDEETEAAEPQEAGGAPLVYLGDLFVGVQLGLQLAAEEPRLVPVTGREEHPAVGISWYGAAAIANYYSRIQGLDPVYDISQAGLNEGDPWDRERRGYRLPTEAEWEFAAIGESGAAYPWGQDVSGARVNYFRSADPFEAVTPPYSAQGGPTTPTAFFDGTVRDGYRTLSNASPAGVFDLVGNVWEWCFDWYIPEIPGADVDARLLSDPRGPAEPEPDAYGTVYRVVRGTGWNTRGENVLVGNRGRFDPAEGSYATGVRLVRDLPGVSR